jgi:hypothetical protein
MTDLDLTNKAKVDYLNRYESGDKSIEAFARYHDIRRYAPENICDVRIWDDDGTVIDLRFPNSDHVACYDVTEKGLSFRGFES